MRRNRKAPTVVVAGVAVALTVAGAAVAALSGRAATATTTVKVTEREYHIALSTTTPPAGKITFKIHNAGHVTHQFDVSGGGLKAVARAGLIAPGATRTLTLTLSGGTVKVWCAVPGHAALGMKATLKVKGSTGAATGGTGGTSTSPTTTSGYVWG